MLSAEADSADAIHFMGSQILFLLPGSAPEGVVTHAERGTRESVVATVVCQDSSVVFSNVRQESDAHSRHRHADAVYGGLNDDFSSHHRPSATGFGL